MESYEAKMGDEVELLKDIKIENPLRVGDFIPKRSRGIVKGIYKDISLVVVAFDYRETIHVGTSDLKKVEKIFDIKNPDYTNMMKKVSYQNAFELMVKHRIVVQCGEKVIRAEVKTEEICWSYRTDDDLCDTVKIISDAVRKINEENKN